MSTIFVHDGTGYTPDGSVGTITREDADWHNRRQSALEVENFKANAPSPYFAYNNVLGYASLRKRDKIATWMGDTLATVTWIGEVYHSGFGDSFQSRRQNFRALSIDGETVYSGTAYLSAGDYVRMRKVKS